MKIALIIILLISPSWVFGEANSAIVVELKFTQDRMVVFINKRSIELEKAKLWFSDSFGGFEDTVVINVWCDPDVPFGKVIEFANTVEAWRWKKLEIRCVSKDRSSWSTFLKNTYSMPYLRAEPPSGLGPR